MKLGTKEFVEHSVVELALAYGRFEDACPDVGWGPSADSLVHQAMAALAVTRENAPLGFSRDSVVTRVTNRRRLR